MLNIQNEKKLTELLKILDSIEKYIILLPEPFAEDIAKYKYSMELMNNIIGQIISNLDTQSQPLILDPYIIKIQKDIFGLSI